MRIKVELITPGGDRTTRHVKNLGAWMDRQVSNFPAGTYLVAYKGDEMGTWQYKLGFTEWSAQRETFGGVA